MNNKKKQIAMGNYTIKGLAKANECEEANANGLADVWAYWLECGRKKQILTDFNRLRKKDKQSMLDYLRLCTFHTDVFNYIVSNIF